ncbi:hypothetical protein BHE74_00057186 [Ensete ventricosum]|nr:hypothetical protein BHE74_00057186 [Ensete ventricosum]
MLPMPIGGLPKGAVPASTASTGVAPPLRALTLLAVSPATVAPTSDHPYRGHGYSLPPLAMGGRPCRGPVCSQPNPGWPFPRGGRWLEGPLFMRTLPLTLADHRFNRGGG